MSEYLPLRLGYLLGPGNSGTTLMAFLMDAHPKIASLGETKPNTKVQRKGAIDFSCTCGSKIDSCELWNYVFEKVRSSGDKLSTEQWTNDHRYRNRLLTRLFSRDARNPILQQLKVNAAKCVPFHRAKIRRANRVSVTIFRALMEYANADAVFDTSKRLIRLQFFLGVRDFDVRVVRLIRDVRAFVYSSKRKHISVDEAALRWKRTHLLNDWFLQSVDARRVLQLRYEDLCKDPVQHMKDAYRLMGVDPLDAPKRLLPRNHHIIGNHMRLGEEIVVDLNERWRTQLTAREINIALRIAGDINERFGYKS